MNLKDKQILIVDDDELTLKMLDAFFNSAGRVFLERDCKGASRVLDQTKVDIVILNLSKADMDDSESCKQMKEKFSKIVTPIIITSTMPVSQYKERLSYLSNVHYFQKPYSSLNLRNTAHKMLEVPITPNQAITFH